MDRIETFHFFFLFFFQALAIARQIFYSNQSIFLVDFSHIFTRKCVHNNLKKKKAFGFRVSMDTHVNNIPSF